MGPRTRETLVIAVLAILVGTTFFDSSLSLTGDNGEFIVIGRALASGQGFVYGNMPGPAAATKFPPGFSVALAATHMLFPYSITAMKVLVLLLFVISVPLIHRVVSLEDSTAAAWVVAGLCMASYLLIEFSHIVLSEVPYLAASLCALYALQRCVRGEGGVVGVILFSAVACSMRSVGIVLIPTAIVAFLMRGRSRDAVVTAAATVLLLIPWTLYSNYVGPGGYANAFLDADPYGLGSGIITIAHLLGRVGANLWGYGSLILPQVLLPDPFLFFTRTSDYSWWMWIPAAVCSAAVAAYLLAWRRPTVLRLYLIFYLGVILLWPDVWSDRRFLVPVTPLLFYSALVTIRDLGGRALQNQIVRRLVLAMVIITTAASNGVACYYMNEQRGWIPPVWRSYFRAGEWIKENAKVDAVVACRKPFLMHLISDRKTVSYPWASPEEVSAGLGRAGANLVVLDDVGFGSTLKYLAPAVQLLGDQFPILHRVEGSKTYILGFVPDNSPIDSVAVQAWRARAHRLEGDLDAALSSIRKAVAMGGLSEEIWEEYTSIGSAYHVAGDREAAKSVYSEVVNGSPEQATALQNLGLAYFEESLYDSSAYYLERAAAIAQDSWELRATLGRVLTLSGRHAEGVDHLVQAVALNPDREDLWTALVEAHVAAGDTAGAVAACASGLSQLPEGSSLLEILKTLGPVGVMNGRRENAADGVGR